MDLCTRLLDDGLDADAGPAIDDDESEVGKDAVLSRDGDDIGGNADGDEVKLLEPELVGKVEFFAVPLDELESDTAAGKLFVGVGTSAAFGVKDGVCIRQLVSFQVMVAYDNINAVTVGKGHLVVRLDSAVKRNQQGEVVGTAVFDALVGDTVTLQVTVRNVIFDVVLVVGTDDVAQK